MTIQELIKKYGCANDEFDVTLIKLYAGNVLCDECPMTEQCPVKWRGIRKCFEYLMEVLEVEE